MSTQKMLASIVGAKSGTDALLYSSAIGNILMLMRYAADQIENYLSR